VLVVKFNIVYSCWIFCQLQCCHNVLKWF